jgi:hypothetical protein
MIQFSFLYVRVISLIGLLFHETINTQLFLNEICYVQRNKESYGGINKKTLPTKKKKGHLGSKRITISNVKQTTYI